MKAARQALAVAAMAAGFALPAVAQDAPAPAAPAPDAAAIRVMVNGSAVVFAPFAAPVQQNGTVLVPLRGVFEKLGANVQYDAATRTIVAVKGPTTVRLALGADQANVNGETRTLSVPALAAQGTTLVPLRFVSEALGAQVKWQATDRTVVITTDARAAEKPPAPTGSAKAEITSFTQNAPTDRPLRANETLTVTLSGTPGGKAVFSLPGIESAQNLPLKESAPGTYVGTFTVPPGLNVGGTGAAVAGQLTVGTTVSPLVQAGVPVKIDAAGPTFASLSPAPDAVAPPGRPLVYGTYADANGTGVSAQTVRLLVNNEDVTARATITEAFFSYPPPADLPAGKNTVVVTLRDAAGNETRREWSFTVTPAETLLKRVTFTPENKALSMGDTLTVRAEAVPGGTARFALGSASPTGAAAAIERPMREESPGVYVGTYEVQRGDSLARAPVSVTFTPPNGRTGVTLAAAQAVTIAAGAPETPVIDTPQEGASVGAAVVTIMGRAAPNATIRVNVSYQGRALLLIAARGTLAAREVKADEKGKWSVENVKLSAPPGVANLSFTATAVSTDQTGEVSTPATVRFRR